MQERLPSGVNEQFLTHENLDHYIINTHAFHNVHLLRSALPRELVKPIPFAVDRRKHHNSQAQLLREAQTVKRATTAAKAADKRQATNDTQRLGEPTAKAHASKKRKANDSVHDTVSVDIQSSFGALGTQIDVGLE
ncbi:hypothetical protein DXG01_005480 [Tephrocybe rancida]|nr:hypothetical protein DXG01_005480 [Tephrocybe rancida]